MTKRYVSICAVAIVALAAFASCSSGILGNERGTIVLNLRSPVGARGIGVPWPFGGLPVFSSLSVTVSGPGMSPMTMDLDPDDVRVEVSIPAGYDRRVAVSAVPDWDATATLYGAGNLPLLATAYGGSTEELDVSAGSTVQANLLIGVIGSKILIPVRTLSTFDSIGVSGSLYQAPSGSVATTPSATSFYEYDRFGRLYVSGWPDIAVFLDPDQDQIAGLSFDYETAVADIAWSISDDRLYGMSVANDLFYKDTIVFDTGATRINSPNGGDSYGFEQGGVAVDSKGFVYLIATEYASEQQGLIKLDIGASFEFYADSTVIGFRPLASLGVDYPFTIKDMTIVDDVLYIAASDIYAYAYMTGADSRSRGAVIAVSCDTLQLLWTAGSSGGSNRPGDPATQFYGPRRFVAIAPKKLFLIDEGFSWDGISGNYLSDVDRIVELDISNGALAGSGLTGLSEFFEDFESIQAY